MASKFKPTPAVPNPTAPATQSRQARSRKAAGAGQGEVGRAGSAGGVVLSKEQDKGNLTATAPTPTAKANPTATAKLASTPTTKAEPTAQDATASGSSRPRRRPRKLNKEPAPSQATTTPNPSPALLAPSNEPTPPASTTEIEALKSRVRGLEAKVEQLYTATEARTGRSPRRRGKGRKHSSSANLPTISTVTAPSDAQTAANNLADDDEEEDAELVALESELEHARRDLALIRPGRRPTRPAGLSTRTPSTADTEPIEEIPRGDVGIEDSHPSASTQDRQVTLTGNYRIPLPATVSMTDVKNIQSGVSAAQNVAKSFLEQRRRAAAATAGTRAGAGAADGTEGMGEEKQSWGEWFGGYSVAISRAVKNNLEAEAVSAGEGRPVKGRTRSAPLREGEGRGMKTAVAGRGGGAEKKGAVRPGLKEKRVVLSGEMVEGLMR